MKLRHFAPHPQGRFRPPLPPRVGAAPRAATSSRGESADRPGGDTFKPLMKSHYDEHGFNPGFAQVLVEVSELVKTAPEQRLMTMNHWGETVMGSIDRRIDSMRAHSNWRLEPSSSTAVAILSLLLLGVSSAQAQSGQSLMASAVVNYGNRTADEPVNHGVDPSRLITVDLACTPTAAAAREIGWDAVEVDDCFTGPNGIDIGPTPLRSTPASTDPTRPDDGTRPRRGAQGGIS
jgi:hypothetical protein